MWLAVPVISDNYNYRFPVKVEYFPRDNPRDNTWFFGLSGIAP